MISLNAEVGHPNTNGEYLYNKLDARKHDPTTGKYSSRHQNKGETSANRGKSTKDDTEVGTGAKGPKKTTGRSQDIAEGMFNFSPPILEHDR